MSSDLPSQHDLKHHIKHQLESAPFVVAALYLFVRLDDYEALKPGLLERCHASQVKGTLLLAREGINGTIAGPREGINEVLAYLRADPRLVALTHKESYAHKEPFKRMKVKLKREIVTMGVPEVDPTEVVGTYVKPTAWNELISRPDVVLVDTRNDYEVKVGSFQGAIDPKIKIFREFPEWSEARLTTPEGKKPAVAMFCTGGIRCEKASSLLKARGYDEVYHLEGGILKYLEEVPPQESLWEGECFVFDERVSVGHGLELGALERCEVCQEPFSAQQEAQQEKGAQTSADQRRCAACLE
jgi:UPF0176 protein